jgi:hypothetical protein
VSLKGTKDGKAFAYRYFLGNRDGENVYFKSDGGNAVCEVRKVLLDRIERFSDKVRVVPAEKPTGTAVKAARGGRAARPAGPAWPASQAPLAVPSGNKK